MEGLFRGVPEPQMCQLNRRVFLLEHSDPGARQVGLSTNTYALVAPGRSLLFDVTFSELTPFVRELHDRGFVPAGLVLSHGHVVGNSNTVRALAREYDIPVFMHPLDARQAMISVDYENPIGHPLLADFGLEALHFPGHTAGHIVLYGAENGGLLLVGDAAMGPTAGQTEAGVEQLVRPPLGTNVDDEQLRQGWLAFTRPVATVLPYHGTGY
jgi:glyoxylase-like metal-dependent hydrolase (beta-lactamase superfamily II)